MHIPSLPWASLGSLFSFASSALAAPSLPGSYSSVSRFPLQKRCVFNSSTSPECWGEYSLSTNYYEVVPDTGVVREYWLEVQNDTMALDGVERAVLNVNGSVPGPTLYADWGDTIVVHVKNTLKTDGTTIHFHGIRQNYTNPEDGVPSITQCPIAPGDSMTYRWRATQYGTTWYHSHYALQAWDGVFGGIVINGPASSAYDEDKGVVFLNDWFHQTAESLYSTAQVTGSVPSDNGLINGTNTWENRGNKFNTTVTKGKSYRLRLINASMNTMFRFMIDGHSMTVIAADLVPITPYTTKSVNIAIGQRYDVIIQADEAISNYMIRAVPQISCSAPNRMMLNITGILNYEGVDIVQPNSTTWMTPDSCDDESGLKPYLALDAGKEDAEKTFDVGLNLTTGLFKWTINSETFQVEWEDPTLKQILQNQTNWRPNQIVVAQNGVNKWVYFVIESALGLAHPIHLHGHDFWVLAQGTGTGYSSSTTTLNLNNPIRRDVAMLPGSGYLVIGFKTDNPGAWLLHCHIGWHQSEGFALQLIERQSEISQITNLSSIDSTCKKWDAFQDETHLVQIDDGV